jgi:hypothetical protein
MIRKLMSRKAARRKCSKSVSTDSRHYPQERGARFAEGGGRFTGMPHMTLRLRYLTLKLRALCWLLRRSRNESNGLATHPARMRTDRRHARGGAAEGGDREVSVRFGKHLAALFGQGAGAPPSRAPDRQIARKSLIFYGAIDVVRAAKSLIFGR